VAHLVVVNRGERDRRPRAGSGRPGGRPPARWPRRRGAGLASFELLGYPDGETENDLDLRGRLVEVVRRLSPTPSSAPTRPRRSLQHRLRNHRDHRVCGYATLDAVAPAAASPLYFPDLGPAHQVGLVYLSGTLDPDTAVDIGAVLERKSQALACHRSQVGEEREWVTELVAQRSADAGRVPGLRHAEVFRLLRLA
jgi:LmbE family N-acetylglucosaminyl deacetylase